MNIARQKDFIKFIMNAVTCGLTGNEKFKKGFEEAASLLPLGGIVAPIIIGVANSIAGNLASDHYGKIVSIDHLLNWMNTDDPNQMNHDLEKLVYRAAISSFVLVRKMYVKEIDQDIAFWVNFTDNQKKKHLKAVGLFFKTIEKELIGEHLTVYVQAERSDLDDPQELISLLAEKISEIPFDGLEQEEKDRFLNFFKTNMSCCLQLAIGEELKTNERAYRAYQLSIVEALKEQNVKLLAGHQELLQKFHNGRSDLLDAEQIRRELDSISQLLLEKYFGKFQEMKDLVMSVSSDIRDLVKIVVHQEGEQTRLAMTITSDKILEGFDLFIGRFDVFEYGVVENFDYLKKEVTLMRVELERQRNAKQENYIFPRYLTVIKNVIKPFLNPNNTLDSLKFIIDNSKRPVLLTGLGGVGKSTTANEYIKTFHNDYDHIAWIEVDYGGQTGDKSIRKAIVDAIVSNRSFKKPRNTLNIDWYTEISDEERMEEIFHTLKNIPGKNILILDNITVHFEEFLHLLPFPPEWKVLATSREIIGHFDEFKINELEAQEAFDLFASLYPEAERRVVFDILDIIGRNTLMIEVIARTLNTNPSLSARELLQIFEEKKLPEADEGSIYSYLVSTFNLSNVGEIEKKVLSLFYYIPSTGMGLREIIKWFNIKDESRFQLTLRNLVKKGWVRNEDQMYSVHSLIEQLIYYQLKPNLNDMLELVKHLAGVLENTYAARESFALLIFIEGLQNKFDQGGIQYKEFADLFFSLGNIYKDMRQLQKAETAFQNSISELKELALRSEEPNDNQLILPILNLAITKGMRGDAQGASNLFYEVLRLGELGGESLSVPQLRSVCIAMDALSVQFSKEYNYKESVKFHQLAMNLAKEFELSSLENIDVLTNVMINGSQLYLAINELDRCINMGLEGLELLEIAYQQHQDRFQVKMVDSLNICATNLLEANEYEKAKDCIDRAMSIIRPLTEDFPDVFVPKLITTMNVEAAYYYSMQLPTKSVNTYEEGLKILLDFKFKGLLDDETDLAELYIKNGIALNKVGRNHDAHISYLKAYNIFESMAPELKQSKLNWLTINMINLANVYREIGEADLAEKLYREVEQRLISLKQDDSEKMALLYNNMGILFREQRNYNQAEQKYLASIAIREKLTKNNPKAFLDVLADVYFNLGNLYRMMERVDDAIDAYFHCCKLREKLYLINHRAYVLKLAKVEFSLGVILSSEAMESKVSLLCKSLQHFSESKKNTGDTYPEPVEQAINKLEFLIQDNELRDLGIIASQTFISFAPDFLKTYPEITLMGIVAFLNLAEHYEASGELDLAETNFTEALELVKIAILKDFKDVLEMGKIKSRIGLIYEKQKKFKDALVIYAAALNHHIDIYDESPEQIEIGSIIEMNFAIARVYGMLGNYDLLMHHLIEGGAVLVQSWSSHDMEMYLDYMETICKAIEMPIQEFFEKHLNPALEKRNNDR